MENAHLSGWFKTTKKACVSFALALSALAASAVPFAAVAQSWDPTLLVNTESFITVDDGDGTTNIQVQFGSSANALIYDVGSDLFRLTGGLDVQGRIVASGSINAQGDVAASGSLRLNTDDTGDATITFGNATLDETLTFSESNARFEFSDDLYSTGDITASGTLSGNQLVISSSAVKINSVQYQFPDTQGDANNVLYNDGSGNLAWGSVNDLGLAIVGSGAYASFHPEYPNVVYNGSGANTVGQLKLIYDSADVQNYYQWSTTSSSAQTYDIVVRWMVPDNFYSWQANAITYTYKTDDGSNSNNGIKISVNDTANAEDFTTAVLANTSETAANITSANLDGTYTDGSYMTVRVVVTATSGNNAYMGPIDFNWYEELLN